MSSLDQIYADIDAWMAAYRAAHPDDDRADLDVLLDAAVYRTDSPYWPAAAPPTGAEARAQGCERAEASEAPRHAHSQYCYDWQGLMRCGRVAGVDDG